jgi:circadian clock protein KaiB
VANNRKGRRPTAITKTSTGSTEWRPGKDERHSTKTDTYVLRLYVTGSTPRAKAAIVKLKSFCEEHLRSHYQLDVVDIYQQPAYAKAEQIIAAPTLVKKLPLPLKKLVGDFSDSERISLALNLQG